MAGAAFECLESIDLNTMTPAYGHACGAAHLRPSTSLGVAKARLFARHLVKDYAVWRQAFDDFAPIQAEMGVTASGVYRADDNPSDVTIWHDFATAEQAYEMAQSKVLKSTMMKAGVEGPPQIWVTNEA